MPPVLTRYLYLQDRVQASLVWAILDHAQEEALYWAYELYYSGYRAELLDLLISIYVVFHDEASPHMHPYFYRQLERWYRQEHDPHPHRKYLHHDTIPGSMVRALTQLPVSLMAMMRYIQQGEVYEVAPYQESTHVPPQDQEPPSQEPPSQDPPDLLLSELSHYKTRYDLPAWKTLRTVTQYPLRPETFRVLPLASTTQPPKSLLMEMALRALEPPTPTPQDLRHQWLYYAASTPVWANRLEQHQGHQALTPTLTPTIEWSDPEQEEQFLTQYDYEMDEQPPEVIDRLWSPPNPTPTPLHEFLTRYGTHNVYRRVQLQPIPTAIPPDLTPQDPTPQDPTPQDLSLNPISPAISPALHDYTISVPLPEPRTPNPKTRAPRTPKPRAPKTRTPKTPKTPNPVNV